ncbi:PREDICTED: guanine deaminase-like [Amphimedon queenslandica]|uniref:Guanine deaminase n=1 Tax=Amphimedon queenslandica TaxID=400682 RepID=A0A1X7VNK8_AMPQE|nr:PREDICTED: guanine deaminase-like [Amphimedon queenslandica]|eukprot:XP_003383532.1 PREDICTED: guanine deaminase-like [Amphimedon queenslandica]
MSKLSLKVFRGRIVHCLEVKSVTVVEDGLIGINSNGQILFVDEGAKKDALMKQFGFEERDIHHLETSQFLMPGLVDTHIHAPQYKFTGTGYDLQLLDWLDKYTFPTEAKFSDVQLASEVYQSVVKRTINNGTTTASYFATIHVESAIELCKIIAQCGQRALVGKVNMDRESPDNYIETTSSSIVDTKKFIEFVEGMKNPLVEAVITPRFLPTCTDELLKQLAELAKKKGLKIQSHLCEQLGEVGYTMNFYPSDQYPSHQNCTQVFDKMGLLNEKTYMAHCIHLKEEELKLMEERKVGIAHCPNSNFCLKSGLMDARDRLGRDLKIGLGTDVSGGFSSSMLDAIRHALQASRALHIKFEKEGKEYEQLTLDEALYMATIGGAKVLNLQDKIGNFEVGKEFDALLIDTAAHVSDSKKLPVFDVFPSDTFEDILSKFVYLGDDRNIIKVFVAGQEIKPARK